MPDLTPEQKAREQIDAMLLASGWIVQDYKAFNPTVARDIALREIPLKSGRCDYLLLVDRKALGVGEAKKAGATLSTVADQSGHYAESLPDFIQAIAPGKLPFLYESTGVETWFRDERDPKPIVDFMVRSVQPGTNAAPAFASGKFTRNAYYGIENLYRNFPSEGTYITCRGPEFTECYDRYTFDLAGVEGTATVIVPKTEAPGKPWVFRSDFVNRDAVVDLALLAKGFHIVTGPVPYNADGPLRPHWDAVYRHLTDHGFSTKPVLEGDGHGNASIDH